MPFISVCWLDVVPVTRPLPARTSLISVTVTDVSPLDDSTAPGYVWPPCQSPPGNVPVLGLK